MDFLNGYGTDIVETDSLGAVEINAKPANLNIRLRREQYPNPYASADVCFRYHYFTSP